MDTLSISQASDARISDNLTGALDLLTAARQAAAVILAEAWQRMLCRHGGNNVTAVELQTGRHGLNITKLVRPNDNPFEVYRSSPHEDRSAKYAQWQVQYDKDVATYPAVKDAIENDADFIDLLVKTERVYRDKTHVIISLGGERILTGPVAVTMATEPDRALRLLAV